MKPNYHKNCGGKFEKKKKKDGAFVYICNRCGFMKQIYRRKP